ncbi:MAG: HAMP domain-containing sensor histidine kinase [Bacteroidota bacterium]
MKSFFQQFTKSLFWRISLVFLLLMGLIGLTYVFVTAYTAQKYYAETTQRLNKDVASHMLHEVKPFENGEVNEKALHTIMHSMMAVNPSLEVYLLDNEGEILSFVVLDKKVKLKSVDLEPVKEFLHTDGGQLVLGDDPRNPKKSTVFSATPVEEEGEQLGYVYMVLASEQYENISETVFNSYLLTLGTRFFTLSLIAAFILGLLMIWLLTRNLRKVIDTVKEFEGGNLEARIEVNSTGELANLSHTFNHMAETILQNIQELKKVDELRRELIANISHDLRTPLSVIHGYVETLTMKQGQLTQEEERKYLDIILNSSEHLRRLVADLFELSKLEARQIKLDKQPFVLSELLQDVSAKYAILAKEKSISIKSNIMARETAVNADLRMIERVLQNLIDNAIKHSPENSQIVLNLSEVNDKVEVSIKNTGVGIPEEDLPNIFDRYYKIEKYYGDKKGTGLGLAIVKNILEMHQSLIRVNSKLNEYTTFYFQLPVYQ